MRLFVVLNLITAEQRAFSYYNGVDSVYLWRLATINFQGVPVWFGSAHRSDWNWFSSGFEVCLPLSCGRKQFAAKLPHGIACWFPVIPFLHECVCVWQDNCVFIWNFRYISLNGSVDFRLFCATIWFFPPWKAFDCFLLSYYSIAFVMGAELNSLLQQWLLPLCSFNKRVFIKQAFHTQCYGKCQLINSINSLACRT